MPDLKAERYGGAGYDKIGGTSSADAMSHDL
jgi:hypothetical protein